MKIKSYIVLSTLLTLLSCNDNSKVEKSDHVASPIIAEVTTKEKPVAYDTLTKTIHIFVALCDNKNQGIVPVPASIGNGQDYNNNLYWGCGYGIRTYFKKSTDWKLIKTLPKNGNVLERLIFKHTSKQNQYLVADAYDGQYIKQCTKDFLCCSAGQQKSTLKVNNTTIGIGGNAQLLAYIGHNGLMDFSIGESYKNTDGKKRDVIILACYSKMYFKPHLKMANVNPLVWTSHLMCPEAYTVHDAITGYINNESNEQIRIRAAKAYAKYQKCSEKAARNLLITN